MTCKQIAACILVFGFAGAVLAQGAASSPETGAGYTQAQVKHLERVAQAPEQFKTLANYYGERQTSYLRLAAAERKEFARMSRNTTGSLQKYPRPVDSARNLYEYYMYKASQAGTLEAKYSQHASSDAPVNGQ